MIKAILMVFLSMLAPFPVGQFIQMTLERLLERLREKWLAWKKGSNQQQRYWKRQEKENGRQKKDFRNC